MADKCANQKCEKELVHIAGRKKKKYCSAACKTIHWQALNPLPKKRVKTVKLPDDYANWTSVGILKSDGTVEELKDLSQLPTSFMSSILPIYNNRSNQIENAARGRDENGVNNDEVEKEVDAESILKKIKAIESEKIPAERNTSLGRKVWQKEQNNRIEELKCKLK